MKAAFKFIGCIVATSVALAFATGPLLAADMTYTINQTSTTPEVSGELTPISDTVSGSITTNGTIGVLQSSDIVSYDLLLTDNIRPAYDVELTLLNSGIYQDVGNGLSASATGLSFDFSDPAAVFVIQGLFHGFSSGYQYFCFQATTGPCLSGETIVPDYYGVDGALATGFSGPVSLSGVPEPASGAMILVGMGMVGFTMRRRAKVSVSPA